VNQRCWPGLLEEALSTGEFDGEELVGEGEGERMGLLWRVRLSRRLMSLPLK
jgi:hypothetical protein